MFVWWLVWFTCLLVGNKCLAHPLHTGPSSSHHTHSIHASRDVSIGSPVLVERQAKSVAHPSLTAPSSPHRSQLPLPHIRPDSCLNGCLVWFVCLFVYLLGAKCLAHPLHMSHNSLFPDETRPMPQGTFRLDHLYMLGGKTINPTSPTSLTAPASAHQTRPSCLPTYRGEPNETSLEAGGRGSHG